MSLEKRSDHSKSDDEQAFLLSLGIRVRRRRETSGLTRRALAQRAGLSERYLAQLELGSGNVSMLLLRKLMIALHCALSDLIEDDHTPMVSARPALDELVGKLRYFDDASLSKVTTLLDTHFGEATNLRRSRIALIGMRGAGKSTVGADLAKAFGVKFVELDQEIEAELGCNLASVFSLYGQDAYREAENRVLQRLTDNDAGFVLATGGSIVTSESAYALLRRACFTVWLRAEPEDHMARVMAQGDLRPMRGRDHAMTELRSILRRRMALYQLADISVNTSAASVTVSVNAIKESLQ